MHNHIAIDLMKSLSRAELKKLEDYISSPYFNKSSSLVKLFKIISGYGPDYTKPGLKKEKLYKKLYPGKTYNEQTIRSRMVELASLVRGFLSINGAENDEFMLKKALVKQYRVKQKYSLAEKFIVEELNELESRGIYDSNYFRDSLVMLDQLSKLYTARDMKAESLRLSYKRGEFTLNLYLNNLLQMNDEIIKTGIEQNEKPDIEFVKMFFDNFNFPEFLKGLEALDYKYYPFMAINYYTNLSMQNPGNEEYFYRLKELVFTHYNKFNLDEIYNYWSMLSNAAFLGYINKGNKYLYEAHEINKFFIENKLYDRSKPLSPLAYQNTVINALMVKDISWADNFTEEFKKMLTGEARENRYNFCRAMVLFEKGEYENSLKFLSLVKHADWHFKINVRMYYLRNYYELGWHEQFNSMVDSFKRFAADNKTLPEYIDDRIKKSLYYIGKIGASKFDGKKLDYADFKEAEQTKIFSHKEWILEKMKELL